MSATGRVAAATHLLRAAEVTLHPATPGAARTATVDARSWQVALQSTAVLQSREAPTLQGGAADGVATGRLALVIDGRMVVAHVARAGARIWLHLDGAVWVLERVAAASAAGRAQAPRAAPAATPHANRLVAPMPGRVLDLLCAPGDAVQAGQTLVLLEAMKMELRLAAPAAATVAALHVAPGAIVERGALLIELAPADE